MQDTWAARKAEISKGTRALTSGRTSLSQSRLSAAPQPKSPLLSTDGNTLLTKKTQLLQRWAERFRGLLNPPSIISDAAIACLPQVETNAAL
ncbi:hypothetical protein SprV_0501819900 [Sparganum proliferum]